ncbi:hypothetical protein TRIP_E110051 [uncultured Spirochaetota bacterium]|uniref:Uncharacterized protein n=1 Tax=uncultured Spirochaetota bacterium TaxID=460511 RepID=A0A652ZS40_9SPIR|nr:hypothetical protein TRIP_E110051 [uncultured Spirochaetota bacterium]
MQKNSYERDFSWEEKYWHVYGSYCQNWNSAINFIAEKLGAKALDEYYAKTLDKKGLGKSAFSDLGEDVDVDSLIKSFVAHHLMLGGSVKVISVDKDKFVCSVSCGSKSRLVKKCGADKVTHYCRHCEALSMYEQMGWHNEVDQSNVERIDGEPVGCRRVFTRIEQL